jgi:hypothetical protein
MNTFNDIKELVSALKREEKLISEMFAKRKSLAYQLNYARELVDYDENRIDFLIQHSVINENGNLIELDDLYREFFEQVLDVNEEINLSYINENIKNIKDNINYYFNENNENRKYAYLRIIKKTLKKIGVTTLRSVVDIRRNIENTFKNEANYKNKQLKLKNLDNKRVTVNDLIKQTINLVDNDEFTFFNEATDEELSRIILNLKDQLNQSSHNLIEIEKQIIDYLNQIKLQEKFVEKLRKLKYLKDHFLIQAETDIKQILSRKNDTVFDNKITEPLKLSIEHLLNDENARLSILKIAKQHSERKNTMPLLAEKISNDFLEDSVEEEVIIDLEEVKNGFVASSDNLFNFVLNYNFMKEIDFNERVTIYCQMVSQFENEFEIEDNYKIKNDIEYALVFPK